MKPNVLFLTFLCAFLFITVVLAIIVNPPIILSTQAEVDALFGTEKIVGNLIITGSEITNLDKLEMLDSLKGNLTIRSTSALTSIAGLSNLKFIGGGLTIDSNSALLSINGLSKIDSIRGNLTITHNTLLANINGLTKIDSVRGSLTVANNINLTNITGLSNLSFIGGDLKLDSNYALLDMSGLSKIDSIGGNLSIKHNIQLANINGLSKIDSVTGSITIATNTALTKIDGLSGLTYIGGGLKIDSNYALLSMNGLSKIDSVAGGVNISVNKTLANLDGLFNLTFVGGGLKIDSNYALLSLNGLSKLNSVIGDITIHTNSTLTNIDGFYNLISVKGDINILENTSLSEFCGLFNLLNGDGISGNLNISGNKIDPSKQDILDGGPCNAEDLIEDLVFSINNSNIPKGTMTSLTHLLENAEKSLQKGNNGAAVNQLEAFINKLKAQDGKKIDGLSVNIWMDASQQIIALIQTGLAKNSNGQILTSASPKPKIFSLDQNYPNPFNPSTTIRYGLPENEKVTIDIYDILGREVAELVNGEAAAGYHEVKFDGSKLSSGIYFYRLTAGSFTQIHKMLLLK